MVRLSIDQILNDQKHFLALNLKTNFLDQKLRKHFKFYQEFRINYLWFWLLNLMAENITPKHFFNQLEIKVGEKDFGNNRIDSDN